jgi:hypothetical protein
MKNKLFILIFFSFVSILKAQNTLPTAEQYPIFPVCENSKDLENCFNSNVQDIVYTNFKIPNDLKIKNYIGSIIVVFEVDATGKFKVQYVDSNEKALIEESNRVFETFPIISPPTFNGKPSYARYTIKIAIPLKSSSEIQGELKAKQQEFETSPAYRRNKELTDFNELKYTEFKNPQFQSQLNIPFSHSNYAQFDSELNQIGSNNHTGSKPYSYADVQKYYSIESKNNAIKKSSKSWWGRKFWNENMVEIQGEDYWLSLNPIIDLQLGKSNSTNNKNTYVNTRALQFQGGLGKQLNFSTTVFESQGYFADYYNKFAESIKPAGGDPAIIPGIGIAKDFQVTQYDFPSAEANLTFTPSKFINMQLGYGRNFIGDGYRSLILSDAASPYPFFKLNTTFWRIKYTNTYMFLRDVRPEVTSERTYASKYIANHYLSLNVSKRFNIGFFESVVWANNNGRGFDPNFINPIIFYRTVEFTSSARSGNALLGLTGKYKFNNQINAYGQFLLDEFSLKDVKAGNDSWKNKFGYQIGAKYYNAFNIDNLLLQAEFNYVRPYVYSHLEATTNYGHNNQSIGHPWGGNFQEFVAIARYHTNRFYADAKLTFGKRGLDFDPLVDNNNYGSNINISYETNRPLDSGVVVGQGNKTSVFIADLQAGYLVNPSTNLKFFGSLIYRNFNPAQNTLTYNKENTTWFSIGLRSDVFNWYFDY